MIRSLLTLVAVQVVASDVLFLVAAKLLRGLDRPTNTRIFLLTRGLGPAAVATSAYTALVFLPGHGAAFYLWILAALFAGSAALANSEAAALWTCYLEAWRWITTRVRRARGLVVATCVLALLGISLGVALPLVEHDGVAAAVEARIALRDESFANYLAIEVPDPQTGYYMETFRTPFLQSLYVVYGWMGGLGHLDFLIRTTSPIYTIHCLLLLGLVVRRHRSSRTAAWSVFLLMVTPIFFYMTYNNGIDTARLYLGFLALLWMAELAATGSTRVAVAAGGASGLALFCHALSAPLLAGGGLAFLVHAQARIMKRLVTAAVLTAVALVTGASFHYLLAPKVGAKIAQAFEANSLQELADDEPGSPEESPATAPEHRTQERAADRATKTPKPTERPQTAPRAETVSTPRPVGKPASPPARPKPRDPEESERATRVEPHSPDQSKPARADSGHAKRPSRVGSQPKLAVERHADLLELRGQGHSPLQRLIFGRLQMFTGLEHFGWIFYWFWAGVALYLLRRPGTNLERILVYAGVTTTLVVLSGVRQLSWSNPRYIATILPLAAFFAGPVLAATERRWLKSRLRLAIFVAVLVFPVTLATAIRGAKVEITNPGTFYAEFRSLEWVRYTIDHPADAMSTFWNRYLGIGKTARYIFADQDEQLRHAHDYFGAVLWIRDHLPADTDVLLFRDARFFYYSRHRGTVWYSPVINQKKFRFTRSPKALERYLRSLGIDYVLVDEYSTRLPGYADGKVSEMLANPDLAERIYEFGTARVYRLSGPVAEDDAPRP